VSTHLSRLRWALCAAIAATFLFSSAAGAALKTPVDLRVVTAAGKTLAEHVQYTGTARVRTSPKADCFGGGTGGSGQRVKVSGPTALGVLKHAALSRRRVRPLLVTDAFSFGLGLCGIGGDVAPQTGYWYLKRNHAGSSAGGDQTVVDAGDHVIWHLIEDFTQPTPAELELRAPARVKKGRRIPVKVLEYADDGSKSRAAGAAIKGTGVVTDANGRARVPAAGAVTRLKAERAGAIPSNVIEVCSLRNLRRCPRGHVTRIAGTNRRDKIHSTRGPDVINAYGGRDVVDVRRSRNSAPPIIKCGKAEDRVLARKRQKLTAARSCERIVRK
jgi:hypothetical protein